MWQRFSEQARRAVFYSQQGAEQYGDPFVDTEHLLLGMLHESENTACQVFRKLGVAPERVRAQLQPQLARRDGERKRDVQLSVACKKAIDYSYDEARALKHYYIGTEHFLLGLLREHDGLAGQTLAELHVRLEDARAAIVQIQLGNGDSGAEGKQPDS